MEGRLHAGHFYRLIKIRQADIAAAEVITLP